MGYFPFTIKNGFRCSTAVGYLNPIKKRKNLKIITNSFVEKIIFESECVRIKLTVFASNLIFIVFITAPIIGIAKWASYIALLLGAIMETVSPFLIFLFFKEDANNLHRVKVLFHVNLLFSDIIDV